MNNFNNRTPGTGDIPEAFTKNLEFNQTVEAAHHKPGAKKTDLSDMIFLLLVLMLFYN